MNDRPLVSIILPCHNEEAGLGNCLLQISTIASAAGLPYEIIVSDSSTDRSPEIAEQFGARLVKHDREGYGIACRIGLAAAHGDFLFLADADGTYDFQELPRFVSALQSGYDLVIGNRFAGVIEPGAMPWVHRWIGSPVFSILMRVLFRTPINDIHCGMRAVRQTAFGQLILKTTGMEFASEMIVAAIRQRLRITQVPINYHQRLGQSKLKTWADGWRHLRFMLLYSPLFLFFLPGVVMFGIGAVGSVLLYFGAVNFLGLSLQYHPMFLTSLLIIVGYQLMIFALFAKTYAVIHLGDSAAPLRFFHRHFTIEKAGIVGLLLVGIGAGIYGLIFWRWVASNFGELNEIQTLIVALTILVVGVQTIFSSFMLSILGIKEK